MISLSTHSQHLVELVDVENGFRNKLSDQYIYRYISVLVTHSGSGHFFGCLLSGQIMLPKNLGVEIGVFSNDFQVTVVDKANVLECSRLWREASSIGENVILVLILSVFLGGCVLSGTLLEPMMF